MDADVANSTKPGLICDECGSAYGGEQGWRGYLTREPREVAVFCPGCAEREFGEPKSAGAIEQAD
jgi:hypothetical protein